MLEIAALGVASIFAYAIGYSLPLLAGIFLIFWPLFLLQLLAEGVLTALIGELAVVYRKACPPKPKPARPPKAPAMPRTGLARSLWSVPLVIMTAGYGRHVFETGRWFL